MDDDPKLSNIREHLGWLIGRTVVEVTAGDPAALPDHDPDDEWDVVLHFDNGGTLEVPIGDDGFTYNNPDDDVRREGPDLLYQFRIASFGLIEDPHAPVVDPRYNPAELCSDCEDPTVCWSVDRGTRPCDGSWFGGRRPRDDDDVVEQVICWDLIHWIEANPHIFAPANPFYLKNHVNAPGTVRQWFRTMRAADLAHMRVDGREGACVRGEIAWTEPDTWSVLDTQTVVDRETAAHYLKPKRDVIYFVNRGRVVGRIDDIDWSTLPSYVARLKAEPDEKARLAAGEWQSHETPWIDFGRSSYPIFSSKLPEPGESRGITLEDIRRFVYEDDARRSERLGLDAASPHSPRGGAFSSPIVHRDGRRYLVQGNDMPPLCSDCGGPVRLLHPPMGYVGPGKGRMLYEYTKLLSANPRYTIRESVVVRMCDACRMAEIGTAR